MKPPVTVRARHLGMIMNFNFWVQVGTVTIANEISFSRAKAKARILAKAIHGDSRAYAVADLWEEKK